jgi:nucleotide-binding universal stress UspA family protein
MDDRRGPRVVVGVDDGLPGLEALRVAVAEGARRGLPVFAVRVGQIWPDSDFREIDAAFEKALGAVPPGVERALCTPPITAALTRFADHPGDLLVVGSSGLGWWHAVWSGSVARGCLARARCAVLVVRGPSAARDLPGRRWRRSGRDLWRRFEKETAGDLG